jgi:uncharacterized protein YbjQ (UPF0145 family)
MANRTAPAYDAPVLSGGFSMNPDRVTTALELPGFQIRRNIGVARGIVVRSRSVVGNLAAALQSLFGGNISVYTTLCEQARTQAFRMMCEHADRNGANAIVAMRYDATEIMAGVTEVICYGTAVEVEEARG